MTTMSELVNMIFSLCLLVGVIMDSVGAFRTWSGAPAPSFDRQRLQGIRTLAVDEFHRELSSLLVKRPQTWDHAPKLGKRSLRWTARFARRPASPASPAAPRAKKSGDDVASSRNESAISVRGANVDAFQSLLRSIQGASPPVLVRPQAPPSTTTGETPKIRSARKRRSAIANDEPLGEQPLLSASAPGATVAGKEEVEIAPKVRRRRPPSSPSRVAAAVLEAGNELTITMGSPAQEDKDVPFLEDFVASNPPFSPEEDSALEEAEEGGRRALLLPRDRSDQETEKETGEAPSRRKSLDPWVAPHLYRQLIRDGKNNSKVIEMYTGEEIYKGGRFRHARETGSVDAEAPGGLALTPPPYEITTSHSASASSEGEWEGQISDATIDWLRENFSEGAEQRMASMERLVITAVVSTPAAAVDDEGRPLRDLPQLEEGAQLKTKYGCCPLQVVNKVFDYLKNGTKNDPRISYSIMNCMLDNGEIVSDLHDSIQMWAQGYNTYHLIDGHAMRSLHGGIRPDIILDEASLRALLDQVCWALAEDEIGGALLSPRQRRMRLRGGPLEFSDGYNTEGDHLYESLSVINY